MERTNYMMTVDDVAQELGVSKQKGYRIIRQLNEELAAAGYMTVQAKVPRTYWCERFYTGKRNAGCGQGRNKTHSCPQSQTFALCLSDTSWRTAHDYQRALGKCDEIYGDGTRGAKGEKTFQKIRKRNLKNRY